MIPLSRKERELWTSCGKGSPAAFSYLAEGLEEAHSSLRKAQEKDRASLQRISDLEDQLQNVKAALHRCQDLAAVDHKIQEQTAALSALEGQARSYLEEHNILPFVAHLLKTVAQEKPRDPWSAIAALVPEASSLDKVKKDLSGSLENLNEEQPELLERPWTLLPSVGTWSVFPKPEIPPLPPKARMKDPGEESAQATEEKLASLCKALNEAECKVAERPEMAFPTRPSVGTWLFPAPLMMMGPSEEEPSTPTTRTPSPPASPEVEKAKTFADDSLDEELPALLTSKTVAKVSLTQENLQRHDAANPCQDTIRMPWGDAPRPKVPEEWLEFASVAPLLWDPCPPAGPLRLYEAVDTTDDQELVAKAPRGPQLRGHEGQRLDWFLGWGHRIWGRQDGAGRLLVGSRGCYLPAWIPVVGCEAASCGGPG